MTSSSWKCPNCELLNSDRNDICQACFEEKPLPNPACDANDDHSNTDALVVSGYIRSICGIQKNIMMPSDIIHLCFLFWFIQECDKWDASLCDPKFVDINGTCARITEEFNPRLNDIHRCTLFGTKSVESGVFVWSVKQKKVMLGSWSLFGIIKDDKDVIAACNHTYDYGLRKGWGCFLTSEGWLYYDRKENFGYCPYMMQYREGSVIEITLNADLHSIKYKINNQECDTVNIDSLCIEKYRLAVTVSSAGDEIELL